LTPSGVRRAIEVSVVVAAWNAEATIGRTLEALSDQDLDAAYEVIVVDDGSDDDTAAIVERHPGGAELLRQARRGPAAARNRGVDSSSGRALAFTDADCFPTPGWLRAGLAALDGAELVQGAVRPDPDAPLGPFDRTVWVVREAGLYETANILLTRDLFERIGGFEDWLGARIGKELGEDVWLGWRARRAGARTAFSAGALVHHAVQPRGPAAYALERLRLVYFADLAAKIPELRDELFFRRYFLSRRTAAFDAAAAGAVVAAIARSPIPLVASAPYAVMALGRARGWGRRRAPAIAAADAVADAVGMGALLAGTVRRRTPVL
jgi:glycosyltransferase involved in cell wall biosynthesis